MKQLKAHLCLVRRKGRYVEDAGISELTGDNKQPLRTVVKGGMTNDDAKLIVSVVNAHEDLLAAARMILRGFAMMEAVDQRGWERWKEKCGDVAIEFIQGLCDATAAIAKAEGGAA